MIANETFHPSSNEVDVSKYRRLYGFYIEKNIHSVLSAKKGLVLKDMYFNWEK